MNEQSRAKVIGHALAEFPRECCGLLVNCNGHEHYHSCRNIALGTDHFIISPEDYANAEEMGEIIAVIHSHPNVGPQPSQADLVACESSGLPWHIVSVPSLEWHTCSPKITGG